MTQIATIKQLRAWIGAHKIYYLNAGRFETRTLKGRRTLDGRAETGRVSAKVFHALDAEIVWLHDPDASDHIGPDELFGLRKLKGD